MKKETSVPAFPTTVNNGPEGTIGMTLRDYFAAQVIAQQLRYCETNESAARQAYKIADAMMEWRK